MSLDWAVYWEPEYDIKCQFFDSESDARAKIASLIPAGDERIRKDFVFWRGEITLLRVVAEVQETPGGLILQERRAVRPTPYIAALEEETVALRHDKMRLQELLHGVLTAISEAERVGCIDHLDCWDDAEVVWDKPIREAKEAVG